LYRALSIDAPNDPASLGDARQPEKKIREIKFENYRRRKFGPHYLLAQDASLRQYIGAAQVCLSLVLQQIYFTLYGDNNSPRFAYLSGHYLLILLYWAGNRKYIKIKTTAKLKAKRTSIATI
jgi:hypothetical protein